MAGLFGTCPEQRAVSDYNSRSQSQKTRMERRTYRPGVWLSQIVLAVADRFCKMTRRNVSTKLIPGRYSSAKRHPRVFSVMHRKKDGEVRRQQAVHGEVTHLAHREAGGAKVISVDIGVWFVIASCRDLSQSNPLDTGYASR
jgi:hypothetical protein